ncbi:hypothetical protein AVEN_240789-1, partial [Araneus ventricosus]
MPSATDISRFTTPDSSTEERRVKVKRNSPVPHAPTGPASRNESIFLSIGTKKFPRRKKRVGLFVV